MSMKEKIARAIAPADFAFYEKMTSITGADVGVNNPMTFHAFEKADAVLTALMEPTDEMIGAFHRMCDDNGTCLVKPGFQAMIRAAQEGK